jgi:hypothetical protein
MVDAEFLAGMDAQAVSGLEDTAAAILAAVSASAPYSRQYPANSFSSAAGNRDSI